MLDTRFPRPRGHIGNALSYDFPVRYKIVRETRAIRIMGDHPDADLLESFVVAAAGPVIADRSLAIVADVRAKALVVNPTGTMRVCRPGGAIC